MTAGAIGGGSLLEALGGAGAVVLAIVGLGRVMPLWMAGIATIVVGAALIVHGAAIAARWNDLLDELGEGGDTRVALGGGMGAEVLGGAAAVVLGVIALSGTMPLTLLAIAAIVLGAALLFGSPTQTELAQLDAHASPRVRQLTTRAAEASTGLMTFAGIGAAVLGIVALIMTGPALTLALVAVLVVGAALLLGGSPLVARIAPRLH